MMKQVRKFLTEPTSKKVRVLKHYQLKRKKCRIEKKNTFT